MTNETKDLDVLRKEYRNMEMNRKSFAEESHSILRKQQQSLEKLRAENENLKTDVATLQARTTMKPLNSFEQSQLDKVTIEIERYKQSIDVERSTISDIEKEITMLKDKIWNQRKSMGGTNAAADNQRNVEKQVKILENRLDQALVKFNKSLANNRRLREEIDNLRGERVAFESVYKKLEKGLQERKKQMAQVIEQSNLAYEQRDKLRLEILAIDQTNKKEQDIFDRNMEELGKKLEEEIKAAAERRKTQLPQDIISEEETKAAAERATKASMLRKEKEAIIKQRKEKIQHFEEAFRKIASSTGIADVDKLVKTFMANDEKNFSLFTYANEQANEIESIEGQIQELLNEKTSFSDSNEGLNQYDLQMKDFESKIESSGLNADKFESKCDECSGILDSLKAGVMMMINRIDCVDDSIGETSVNEANMLHFLGLIEEKTNEILNNFYVANAHHHRLEQHKRDQNSICDDSSSLEDDDEEEEDQNTQLQCVLGVGPKLPMGSDSMTINPPKLLDYSSDENSVDDNNDTGGCRPLTIDEVKSKMITRIGQKRNKGNGAHKNHLGGRRGSILQRRRTSILVANNNNNNTASSMMISRRQTALGISNEVR